MEKRKSREKRLRTHPLKHETKPVGCVETHEDLGKLVPKVARLLAGNPHFAAIALTNPIRALEFVGYRLSPKMRKHLYHRLPALFGSSRAFHRALHSTRGLPWVQSVRFVRKPNRSRRGK